MSPNEISTAVRAAGCNLVTKEGRLFVTPSGRLPASLRPVLEQHKDALIEWLAVPQWTDEQVSALARFWQENPDAEDCFFVRATDGTFLGCASSAELAEWERRRRS